MFRQYFDFVFDLAHFFELFFIASSWTLLENKPWKGREPLLRWFRDLVILYLLLMLGDVILTGLYRNMYLLYWLLMQGAVSLIYVFIHQEERTRAGFVLWCSMYAGSISLSAIGGQLSIILGASGAPGVWQGLIRVIFNALCVLLAMYLNDRRLDEYENVPTSGLIMVLAGDLCLFVIRHLESRWLIMSFYFSVTIAAAYFCVLVLVLCAVYAVNSICREQAKTLDLLAEKKRAESEQELVTLTQKQLDDLHQLRHDIKNQYAYMRILLAQKRYDELEEYFQRQDGELSLRTTPLDCGNRCVSIVLNMERQKAEAVGVPLHTKLVVPPVLPFPDDEMCSLLSNLIDNAVEECVRLGAYFPRVKEQGVSLSINPGNPSSDYLYIEVRNPTDRKSLARRTSGIVSTKGDAALHGYGTRIVTRLAEKYNGSALFEAKDGMFTARVILDMMFEKKEEEKP